MNKEDYFKYYIQGSDHYLIPKDVFDELFNEMVNWKEESQELKENYERIYNENCKLREEHNITDISLLDENYKLKDNWNELKECLKDVMNSSEADDKEFVETILDIMQELEAKK